MATTAAPSRSLSPIRLQVTPVAVLTAIAFAACFGSVIVDLVYAWLHIPESAHGILIAPVAIWLAWRTGLIASPKPSLWSGSLLVILATVLCVFGQAAGVETVPRGALVLALIGLTVCYAGWAQVIAWWLPFVLFILTIPIPESVLDSITIPLQGTAAHLGAILLSWRHIPVLLLGNVIQLPGHTLFVSEACSGLRSLTALVSMAVLMSALFLRHILSRILLFISAVILAIVVNGARVFLTGFLVFFVDQKLGEGFMHLSEGYLLFIVSLTILAVVTWLFAQGERYLDTKGVLSLPPNPLFPGHK